MKFKGREMLLATVSLAALTLPGAFAQTAPQVAETPAPAAQTAQATDTIPEVVVFGAGQTRQVETISHKDLLELAPGTSPLSAISKLPSVNFQSSDPYGAYEWSTRITVRGFSQYQLGFTLDDVPLGDMSYGNYNGLHISRAISAENIRQTTLSQGTGSLGTASTSNLGGAVQFFSVDPSDKFGAQLEQGFGSDATFHTFAKLDSGILSTGTKFYLSYDRQDQEKWKAGHGHQKYDQLNFKLVQPVGNGKVSVYFDYSDRAEDDYQDLSLKMVGRLGRNWDNYDPNWARAFQIARVANNPTPANLATLPYPESSFVTDGTVGPFDLGYGLSSGLRQDYLGDIAYDVDLTDSLHWKTTLYGHGNHGAGLWAGASVWEGFPTSPTGSPITLRTTEYDFARGGVITALNWDIGKHSIETGIWYEHGENQDARRFYDVPVNAPPDPLEFPSNPILTQSVFGLVTDTFHFHLSDSVQLTDSVTATAGFKSVTTTQTCKILGGSAISSYGCGSLNPSDPFLPQFGLNWKASADDEFFINVANNIHDSYVFAYPGSPTPFIRRTPQAILDEQASLHPESSWTYEGGYRVRRDLGNDILKDFTGVIAAYHVDFSNRLIAIAPGPAIAGKPSQLFNAGSVTTNGAEIAGSFTLPAGFSWYNAGSFNDSTYDDNVNTSGGVQMIAGRSVVDVPKFMYKTVLSYEHEGLFANLSGDYMSHRFFTYTNDQRVSGRFLVDLAAGYKFGAIGPLADASLQLNVYNLFDRTYVGPIGTTGFGFSGDNQTLQFGAPRQFFVTLGAKF